MAALRKQSEKGLLPDGHWLVDEDDAYREAVSRRSHREDITPRARKVRASLRKLLKSRDEGDIALACSLFVTLAGDPETRGIIEALTSRDEVERRTKHVAVVQLAACHVVGVSVDLYGLCLTSDDLAVAVPSGDLSVLAGATLSVRRGVFESLCGLSALRRLSLRGPVERLAPLREATQLESLELLELAGPVDLSPVRCCERLSKLAISMAGGARGVIDLTPLAVLDALTALRLDRLVDNDGLSDLAGLRLSSLSLQRMFRLTSLDGLSEMTSLQSLALSSCKRLETLAPVTEIPLRRVILTDLLELRELDGLQGHALRDVTARGLERLETVRHLAGSSQLRALELSDCTTLSTLEGLGGVPSLESLWLHSLPRLRDISALGELSGLVDLDVSGCERLEQVGDPRVLEGLEMLGLGSRRVPRTGRSLADAAEIRHYVRALTRHQAAARGEAWRSVEAGGHVVVTAGPAQGITGWVADRRISGESDWSLTVIAESGRYTVKESDCRGLYTPLIEVEAREVVVGERVQLLGGRQGVVDSTELSTEGRRSWFVRIGGSRKVERYWGALQSLD